mgnify:CR=1 FL=1
MTEDAAAEEKTAPLNTTAIGSEDKRKSGPEKLEVEELSSVRSSEEEAALTG